MLCKTFIFLGKIILASMWYKDDIEPDNNEDIHRLCHLFIPSRYQYFTLLTNLISLRYFFVMLLEKVVY